MSAISRIAILCLTIALLPGCSLLGHQPGSEAFAPKGFTPPALQAGANELRFPSHGIGVAAIVHVPRGDMPSGGWPAIVVSPPDAGVKEQTAGLYAKKLNRLGFVTVAFDPRGFGESGGLHRGLLDQFGMAEDVMSAVSMMRQLPMVNREQVFAMGIASGSVTAVMATAFDSRIKAVAMVTPHLTDGDELLERAGSVQRLRKYILPQAAGARDRYFKTGQFVTLNMVPETAEELAASKDTRPLMQQAAEYYLNGGPGDVPNWSNDISAYSLYPVMASSLWHYPQYFDTVPVFIAYGGAASTAWYATDFYDKINGPKEILKIDGARHFDLYWKPQHVDPTVKAVAAFIAKQIN